MSLTSHLQASTLTSLEAPAAKSATFNTATFDSKDYEGGICFLLISAAGTGTSPTLDVDIQHSSDGTIWDSTPVGEFTQVTDAATSNQKLVVVSSNVDRYLRCACTIGGTSPSFAMAVSVLSQKQNT